MVKNNRGEVEGLFDKRSSAEQAFLERYMAAAEAYERQLEDLRCADAEDYNLLKVRYAWAPVFVQSPCQLSTCAACSAKYHMLLACTLDNTRGYCYDLHDLCWHNAARAVCSRQLCLKNRHSQECHLGGCGVKSQ